MADPVAILEFPEAVATVTFPERDPAVAQVELPTFEVVAMLDMPDVAVVPGPSAYSVAVLNGFVGTEAEWLASLAQAVDLPDLPDLSLIFEGALL